MKKIIISGLAGVALMSFSACSSMNQNEAAGSQPNSTSPYATVQSQVPFPDTGGFYVPPQNYTMLPPPADYNQ
jgi:hypothetical protein